MVFFWISVNINCDTMDSESVENLIDPIINDDIDPELPTPDGNRNSFQDIDIDTDHEQTCFKSANINFPCLISSSLIDCRIPECPPCWTSPFCKYVLSRSRSLDFGFRIQKLNLN